MLNPEKDEPPEAPMPSMLHTVGRFPSRQIDSVRRIAYELGGARAIDNTRREFEATRLAMARVEALARHVPPMAGESSPEVVPAA
jgi:hypothetical protein